MGAFIVSKTHIDALVDVALYGPTSTTTPGARVHPWHAWLGPTVDLGDPDALGRRLWLENLASVAYRYPQDTSGRRPGSGDTDEAIAAYTFTRPRYPRTLVEALKALSSYEYRSSEHRGWTGSAARAICTGIREACIAALPGYDGAAWEILAAVPAAP